MLRTEIAIVEKLCQSNAEFKELFENHIRYEQDLEALYSLKFFPPEVEARMKELKVLKLRGKDKIEQIIIKYKADNGL